MRRTRWKLLLGFGAALAVGGGFGYYARAAMNVPGGMAYSGLLKNNGTVEAGAKMHDFVFELLDGNATLCTDTRSALLVTDGRFDVGNLFSGNGCNFDLALAQKPTLFIRTTVDNQVLAPPQALGTVPYAARARVAETVESLPPKYRYQGAWTAGPSIILSGAAAQTYSDVSLVADGATSYEVGGGAQSATQLRAGVTFTPPRTGLYKVTAQFVPGPSGKVRGVIAFRLSDGTTAAPPFTNSWDDVVTYGVTRLQSPSWTFSWTGGNAVTVRLQQKKGDGNDAMIVANQGDGQGIVWQIEEL